LRLANIYAGLRGVVCKSCASVFAQVRRFLGLQKQTDKTKPLESGFVEVDGDKETDTHESFSATFHTVAERQIGDQKIKSLAGPVPNSAQRSVCTSGVNRDAIAPSGDNHECAALCLKSMCTIAAPNSPLTPIRFQGPFL
jgi:hypothetical protein